MHTFDKRRKAAKDRFFDRISPEPNSGCWLWTGATNLNGYGCFSPSQKRNSSVYAHRFSYEMHVGPIAEGMVIDHLCRVRCCVNPAHMEIVTRGENVRRGIAPAHVARRAGTCERGHPLAKDNVIGRQKPRCKTCHHEWCEQRDVRKIIDRIVQRARATAALHQPNS